MKGLLSAVIVALLAAWGMSLLGGETPAGVHPLWLARQELLYLSGLLAIGLMSLATYLAARPAWLETPLGGMDRVYRTHKWAGILAGVFAILHWLVEQSGDILKSTIGRAGRVPGEDGGDLLAGLRHMAEEVGEWGFYLLIVLIAITLWKRFPYRPWRFIHRVMPAIYLVLAFHSVLLAPLDYWTQPAGVLLALLVVAGIYGAVRALLANIGSARRLTGTIVDLQPLSPDVLEVRCRLDAAWPGHRAGQFALVTFDAAEGPHPFTIASADRGDGCVTFCIKSLGDYTRQLRSRLLVGAAVTLEGPYGRFDLARRRPRARQLWVAGGIGVTPFLAWLEGLQAANEALQAELHYCTANAAGDPFVERLRQLCHALPGVRLRIHDAARGERLDAGTLLGEQAGTPADVWFCGPAGLAGALRAGLAGRMQRGLRFHQEAFEMR